MPRKAIHPFPMYAPSLTLATTLYIAHDIYIIRVNLEIST